MANLQVKNVPDALYRQIRRRAADEGRTIRDFVLDAVRGKLARDEFLARLRKRRPVTLDRSAGELIDEVRRGRDSELPP